MGEGRIMSAVDVRAGVLPADSSLINSDFIRRLQEQRTIHKREVAFHLAQIDKHGAADEALESMIQAAEKIMAIMLPGQAKAADAPARITAEDVSDTPRWTEAPTAMAGQADGLPSYTPLPTPQAHEDLMSDVRTGTGGNSWRARLLGSHG